ncbi:MAG: AMP-binding protein, partial [Acidimicrobiia bacterium]
MNLEELAKDRAALRERWYREGFFGTETMADHVRHGARKFPDAEMIFVGSEHPGRANLAEMDRVSDRVAAGLWNLGLRAGDVVAVQVPNWLEGALAYQATFKLGLVIVPIVHIYGPAEVGFILNESKAKALIIPQRWRNIDYLARIAALRETPALEHIITIGDAEVPGTIAWSKLEEAEPCDLPPLAGPDEVCMLIYTSGTTADPKGVQHTSNTLAAEVRSTRDIVGAGEGIVNLAAFPAGHIGGVLNVLRTFMFGCSSVLMDTWDATVAANIVNDYRANSTAGAPFYLTSMMAAANELGLDMSPMTGFMVGAASVPPAIVHEAQRNNIIAYRAYGSSEHPVITTGSPSDALDKRATTDGRLTPGNEVRLVDEDDNDVPIGVDGEILSRGPELFIGYRNPALDEVSFLPGGWFRTGDIGRLDEEGYLTITDRKKDVIIRGGENISSKEVEDVLASHPSVFEAAVVAMPDERYGEKVAAFVLLNPGCTLDLDEVRRHFVEV